MQIRILQIYRDHPVPWLDGMDNRLQGLHFELFEKNVSI